METVEKLLRSKSSDIWSVEPETTTYEALEFMAEKNIGALLVTKKGKLVGIFSERDYARKVILQGKSSKDTPVSELMTREVCYVNPNTSIEECMALMTEKHIRHLPVLANEKTLIGIITLGDVIKQIISYQEYTIRELEKYISS